MDAIALASYITNWDKNIQNLIGANKKKIIIWAFWNE